MSFADTIFPWLLKLRRADGAVVDGQCDASGNLKVAVVGTSESDTLWIEPEVEASLTHSRLIASQGGRRLYRILGVNAGPEPRWLTLFDLPRLPPPNAQPLVVWPVGSGEGFSIEFPRPRLFKSGMAWAVSTSAATYIADEQAAFRLSLELL